MDVNVLGLRMSSFGASAESRGTGVSKAWCNRHVNVSDHMMGHKYCIKCRQPASEISARAVEEATVLWRTFERVTGRQLSQALGPFDGCTSTAVLGGGFEYIFVF